MQEGQALAALIVAGRHDHAADHVGMAVQVLGGRMHDEVETQLDGALHPGRGEGVVAACDQAMALADFGDRLQVDQLEQGVGRRLQPDQLGLRQHRRFHGLGVGHVDEAEAQTGGLAAHVLEQAVAAAVEIVAADHVAAALQQVQD